MRGTWNVLEACRAARRRSARSSPRPTRPTARATSCRTPRTCRCAPRHPYDASKAAADLIARSYWHTYGLPVAVTRFANIYGGGDQNRSRLIPEAIAAVLEGRAPVVRSDGSPERDFLYVEDAVERLPGDRRPARRRRRRGAARRSTPAAGAPHRVLDVSRAVCAAAGVDDLEPDVRGTGTPDGRDRPPVGRRRRSSRASPAGQPQVGLDEGLRRTIDWYREQPDVPRGRLSAPLRRSGG